MEPKPPPMCSDSTRTEAGSSENSLASSSATHLLPWLESWTSRRPPSQRTVAACGSMGWWCSSGVLYRASTTTADAASSRSRSPLSVSMVSRGSGMYVPGRSGANSMSCGSVSYRTTSASAASLACSEVSATTSATGQPAHGTRSLWKSPTIGSGCPSRPV